MKTSISEKIWQESKGRKGFFCEFLETFLGFIEDYA